MIHTGHNPPNALAPALHVPGVQTALHSSIPELFEQTAHLPCSFVQPGGDPYLERFFLVEGDGFYVYLHRFVAPDKDRFLHNHPWDEAYSSILHGGYTQRVPTHAVHPGQPLSLRDEHLAAGARNYLRGADYHQIVTIEPETWTLFAHTEWTREWGFLEGDLQTGAFAFRPHLRRGVIRWWDTAPLGKDSPRQPLQIGRYP